ncbi:hypothetical protein L1887_09169 [Cichorium endivia]|nr:hypothetical protein L1887_09169 [Cichorium endivia]
MLILDGSSLQIGKLSIFILERLWKKSLKTLNFSGIASNILLGFLSKPSVIQKNIMPLLQNEKKDKKIFIQADQG